MGLVWIMVLWRNYFCVWYWHRWSRCRIQPL